MRGALLLFRLSLKRVWILLAATGLSLGGFQMLRVLIAASVHKAGELDQIATLLPPFVRAILGPALMSVLSFKGLVCGGYYDLGIVIALVALSIALATLPASEIETGFADLILARPLPRHWVITRTIALVLFVIVLMLLVIMAATWCGGGKVRVIEIPDRALLDRLDRTVRFPLLQGNATSWARRIEKRVAEACAELGIKCPGTHGFRASAAQRKLDDLVAQAVSEREARRQVSRMLGHNRTSVTHSYAP